MEPTNSPVVKKKKKSKRPSSRKVQAAEDAVTDNTHNSMDTPVALMMKDDSLNTTKARIKKTKKDKKKKKSKKDTLSMSVNDLGGATFGGLGESLQRLNLSSGDLDNNGPDLDCLKTVAELSVETFQLAPIPGAEDLTVGIDIHRERKKKKKDKAKKDETAKLKKQQQRRQTTGGLGNLEGQLSQLFLQNKFKNTYDAIAAAEDLQTVADAASVASFHPVKFEDEDRHHIDLMRSSTKKDKVSSRQRRSVAKEEPEERIRGSRSRARDIPSADEEKDDSALPSKAEKKERRRKKESKPEKKRRSKSMAQISLDAHLQSMSDLKYEGISMPTKNTANPYNAMTADDIESVADLSVGTFQPINDTTRAARNNSRRGASLLGPMRG